MKPDKVTPPADSSGTWSMSGTNQMEIYTIIPDLFQSLSDYLLSSNPRVLGSVISVIKICMLSNTF